jgi:hypothetical protein
MGPHTARNSQQEGLAEDRDRTHSLGDARADGIPPHSGRDRDLCATESRLARAIEDRGKRLGDGQWVTGSPRAHRASVPRTSEGPALSHHLGRQSATSP